MQYYPLLLYSVVPLVNATLYTYLAKALNDFEEHSTVVIRKNMLVIKVRCGVAWICRPGRVSELEEL